MTALERFEQICNSGLQACSDEDVFGEVVEQDGSEGIGITWSWESVMNDEYIKYSTLVL